MLISGADPRANNYIGYNLSSFVIKTFLLNGSGCHLSNHYLMLISGADPRANRVLVFPSVLFSFLLVFCKKKQKFFVEKPSVLV